MESRIRVAVDFQNGNSPIIHVAKKSSEDVRDDLLGAFIESFPNSINRWAKIVYIGEDAGLDKFDKTLHYHIVPLSEAELEEEVRLMSAYLKSKKEGIATP